MVKSGMTVMMPMQLRIYSAFEGKNFGIVDDVDKDGVYFRSDAPNTPEKDLDLDDDIAFYLVWRGLHRCC